MTDVPLPPGAIPLKLSVPAFWYLDSPGDPPQWEPFWQRLNSARSAVSVVVVSGDWPQIAANPTTNPNWKQDAVQHLDDLPGVVLGYVGTRSPQDAAAPEDRFALLSDTEILDRVDEWYNQFGSHIDGIYFDELVIPEDPGSENRAVNLVNAFKTSHPGARAMILAGQANVESVVSTTTIDWTLLWEAPYVNYPNRNPPRPYLENFYPLVVESQSELTKPIPERRTIGTSIPSWWKDPRYRSKIAHTVHNCAEPGRQNALGLANERNAGNVFVMDQRGLNNNGQPALYDHLPPYWETEVSEANSYYDFGFDPQRVLLAAHRYGVNQGRLHAWPNFEAAWYSSGHVRGTFLLDAGAHAEQRDVPQASLPGIPPLFDVPVVWRAAHEYARAQGFETAIPTFEQVTVNGAPAYRIVLFHQGLPWLTPTTVPLASTYQQPTFAEPGSVIRNIHRWAVSNNYTAAFPTFVPDDPAAPQGRRNLYNCYVLGNNAPVSWQDVPTSVYIQQL